MSTYALPKVARLTSKKAIDRLFGHPAKRSANIEVCQIFIYPLRVCYSVATERNDNYTGVKIMISVPKKRIRHAVDRVLMRRRIREAWRLSGYKDKLGSLDVAFIYVADKVLDYNRISLAISKIIAKLQPEIKADNDSVD